MPGEPCDSHPAKWWGNHSLARVHARCAAPAGRAGQHTNSSSRDFIINHIGLALGSVPTVGGGGGQGDRHRLLLRDLKRVPAVGRRLASLRVPPAAACATLSPAVPHPQPLTHAVCTHRALTLDLVPAALLAACSQGALRKCPSTSSSSPAREARIAIRASDVTNEIEGVDIDSIGIAAGRRSASLMQS